MIKTARQLKDKVRNMTEGLPAASKSEKAQMLIRNFLMERLHERISVSKYKKNFILKGGMLVASYTGLNSRATKDIDTTINALDLNTEKMISVLEEIIRIDLDDNIVYELKGYEDIMDDFDYPGIRYNINAKFDTIDLPLQIDMSTDDVITPAAVEYNYKLMLEERTIPLQTYNLETLLAEKLQTIISRGESNTRIRDFYDIYILNNQYASNIDYDVLWSAFEATSKKRQTLNKSEEIYSTLDYFASSKEGIALWNNFKRNRYYVGDTNWNDIIDSIRDLAGQVVIIEQEISETEEEDMDMAMI